jgi:hypothetical protein
MSNLSVCWSVQEKWREAEELSARVLQMREKVLGSGHPDTLTSMANLAFLYCKQGKWGVAGVAAAEAMEKTKGVLGLGHPDTLTRMENLAFVWRKQSMLKKAENLQMQIIEVTKQVYGPRHQDACILMRTANLASLWWEMERWRQAEVLQIHVLAIAKQVLGVEHPNTLKLRHNLHLMQLVISPQTQSTNLKQVLAAEELESPTSASDLHQSQGKWQEVGDLDMEMTKWMPQSVSAIQTNLDLTDQGQGRWTIAENIGIQTIQHGNKQDLGQEHPASTPSLDLVVPNHREWKDTAAIQEQVTAAREHKHHVK